MGAMSSTRFLNGSPVKILMLGAKANAACHRHNDKGSFVLEFDGDTYAADPGGQNYADADAKNVVRADYHNMLVPLEPRENEKEAISPVDIRPSGKGDEKSFHAEISPAPASNGDIQEWKRTIDSPAPDRITITDSYRMAPQHKGARFLWITELPWKQLPDNTIRLDGPEQLCADPLSERHSFLRGDTDRPPEREIHTAELHQRRQFRRNQNGSRTVPEITGTSFTKNRLSPARYGGGKTVFPLHAFLVRIERLCQRAWTAGTTAAARHDFKEIAGQFALAVKLEHFHGLRRQTVDELDIRFEPAFRKFRMSLQLFQNRIRDSAAPGEVPRRRGGGTRDRPLRLCKDINIHCGEYRSKFFKSHHPVHFIRMERHFVAFCNTRADKYNLCIGVLFPCNIRSIKHRARCSRNHREKLGRVFLRSLDISRTAGGCHEFRAFDHFLLKLLRLMLRGHFRTERNLDHILETDLRNSREKLPDGPGELIPARTAQ